MKRLKCLSIITACLGACLSSALGAALVVTPSNLQGWGTFDTRVNGTAGITGAYARNGNGSLQLNLTTGADKAGFAYQWNPTGTNPFGVNTTLGNLDGISYDWLRGSSSTVAGHLQPAFKLLWLNDTNGDGSYTVGEKQGFLIWESVYNGGSPVVPTDTWTSSNVLGANFWQWTTGSGANEDFDVTLAQWVGGNNSGHVNSTILSGSTLITGIEVDAGSGWTGQFTGAIDNVSVSFAGGSAVTSNFEVVPEPSGILLSSFAGMACLLRRKRA